MALAHVAYNILDVIQRLFNIASSLNNFFPMLKKLLIIIFSVTATNIHSDHVYSREVRVEQNVPDVGHDAPGDVAWADGPVGADVGHLSSDGRAVLQATLTAQDVPAWLLAIFPKEANAGVCPRADAQSVDITDAYDAVVKFLRDEAAIPDAPEIKNELGRVKNAAVSISKRINEVDESEGAHVWATIMREIDKAADSVTESYCWAKRKVLDMLDSPRAMTKQAKLQVVLYIVDLAYATQIRVGTRLLEREMAGQEIDKERCLNRACEIVDDFIAVVDSAFEALMLGTSLLEVALDYQQPIAMYLTLMMRFRTSMNALKSPGAKPDKAAEWDDRLSPIRDETSLEMSRKALYYKLDGAGNQDQEIPIYLHSVQETLWWARFTGADLSSITVHELRTRITTRQLCHVLGAESEDIAGNLALRPGQKSTLLQLPPASALRAALCANINHARQEIYAGRPAPPLPHSFARTSEPPPVRLHAAAPRTLTGHSGYVSGVAVCPDGDRMLSSNENGTVILWDLSTGQPLLTFSFHSGPVNCVTLSPDGRTAVSGIVDKSVRVWSLESGGNEQVALLQGHSDTVWAVGLSPDGRSIASGSADKTVKIWNKDSGHCQATLREHSDTVHCVTFTPDGERLISGSADNSIRVWNARTGVPERTLRGHSGGVTDVAVTLDGQWLVSGSADFTVRVWSLSSGEEEMRFEGHSKAVRGVAVFPDGQRIASASLDGSVRVWNLRSKALELELTGHGKWVECVGVSPDGRSVVSGSFDETIKVWALSSGDDAAR